MPPIVWKYRKWGACDYCPDESARLYSPEVPGLHVVTPPLFCFRCQARFERHHEAGEGIGTFTREG